ncbi:TIR domain-containing protein [Sphingomonas glacialis]|uniref:CD-NTase-associated protein 12/Pycsar effector protein TIR domain-containing protein n=1 Tax=Sphingomonas glacialis TaxID=658225 RepID=A0A502FCC0_9SPHN|nr:TIR domain-containing protein [Sphingomonas glacialis]TPG46984.1 hypothetical protein EAH76_22740 [Sphingomonas glacialis]
MAREPSGTRTRKKPEAPTDEIIPETATAAGKRAYLRQADVPNASLDDALRVPQAIYDHYAGKTTSPLHVAKALNVDPKGSQLRVLTGAAAAFGLVEGGAQAASITPTELARRIIPPRAEDEDVLAKREAVLKPRVFGDFLRDYDGSPFPRDDIALNVLEGMGVPRAKAEEVFERIEASARSVGFIEEIRGKLYVSLNVASNDTDEVKPTDDSIGAQEFIQRSAAQQHRLPPEHTAAEPVHHRIVSPPAVQSRGATLNAAFEDDQRRRRVFITHGKDRALVEPIRKLLEYGELEPVISVERQSVSKPVPEKIMDDMRKCGAAIIHVDNEMVLKDENGQEHAVLNPNVLIEIGAAMAFYGRRFILLVRDGVKLPSNLQGLYEVRYPGDILDAGATIKLLEAMKDIKNYGLPGDAEPEQA